MLLKELFDTERMGVEHIKSQAGEQIGRGFHSDVSDNMHDPHTVIKHSRGKDRAPLYDDGFWEYASYITKNRLATKNPHFPRIYKFDIKNKTCEMERLVSYKDIEPEILRSYVFSCVDAPGYTEETMGEHDKNDVQDVFCQAVSDALHYNDFADIKRSTLKTALLEIRKLWKEYGMTPDIHGDNIMYRRTGIGIEAVFSDPF